MKKELFAAAVVIACSLTSFCFGQETRELSERAQQELHDNNFPAAERDFREVVKRDPANLIGNFLLGQSLFRQENTAKRRRSFRKHATFKKTARNSTSRCSAC